MVQKWQDSIMEDTYFSLVLLATQGKISFTRKCLNGKLRQPFCFMRSLVKNGTLTKDKDTNSLTMNNLKKTSNVFLVQVVLGVRCISTF
jgi:hypothetical protein